MSQSSNGTSSSHPRPTYSPATVKANLVVFRNPEGAEVRGCLVRMTRQVVFFELYNPADAPLLSEALTKFQIIFQDRAAYAGRAVVHRLVNTGVNVTCEVNVDETGWRDVNPVLALQQNGSMASEFRTFLNEWQNFYKLSPEYKIVIADLQTFLTDARLWLNQLEVGLGTLPAESRACGERRILTTFNPLFAQALAGITERFEQALNQVDRDMLPLHQSFVRRFLHPVTQCSPFMHRAFEKPLGYAGDFEMVDMMFRDPFQGDTLFAKLVNSYALQLPPVVAHRNRIQYLVNLLGAEALRAMSRGRPARVFNLGCGPAREVQQFVAGSELSHHASFVLADFEEQSLRYTDRVLQELKQRHQRRTGVKTARVSVAQLIKEHERRDRRPATEPYDLAYCAGLFDYLTDAVCRQLLDILYAMLAPGGLLVATNVEVHPAINQMECFLDWHLNYRNPEAMRELVPTAARSAEVTVKCDASGANVFLEVRKPA